jgi:glycosyltransferase involved in cell wall biosynthesis
MELVEDVTVICIAYNHEGWIEETLESVRMQNYSAKELIIVDNGSSDKTAEKIQNWINQAPSRLPVKPIFLTESKPYCSLFNEVLSEVKSKYVVDLSGDDVLYPEHLSASISVFKRSPEAAFVFSDAFLLDDRGEVRTFYRRNESGDLIDEMELSTIFGTLIRKNFICSPTIVFNTGILKREKGYDESLYYEDFDVQIRLAKKYPVVFSPHVGVLKRQHSSSMSAGQYHPHQSQMLPSTVKVCQKILKMNLSLEEKKSLKIRILYELKHALWSANFIPARELVAMGTRLEIKDFRFLIYKFWAKRGWDISWLYIWLT